MNALQGNFRYWLASAAAILLALAFAVIPAANARPGGSGGNPGIPGTGLTTPPKNEFNILMNYELGMHCTGFEFAYCCVLPPYNSILAQVVKTEKDSSKPMLLEADPSIRDGLGRPYVVRDPALDGNGQFRKYVLRYWHDAQPRNDGRGAPQTSTLISQVEGNSLLMWNTRVDAAVKDTNGALTYAVQSDHYESGCAAPAASRGLACTADSDCDSSSGAGDGSCSFVTGAPLGNGTLTDANDNYWNAVWNHLYIYAPPAGAHGPLEGKGNTGIEADKIRLGIDVVYPENTGAALQPMGPGVAGAGFSNVLTFSEDTGTVVYTQMRVLEDLPVMLTSPRIWEALGLPLTPFEDTIAFFTDPGAVDEDSLRPYVQMKAQLHNYDASSPGGIGTAVMDNGHPVIGMGTAPIDIPNCERCHSLASGASVNSAQANHVTDGVEALVNAEIGFWKTSLGIGPSDSDWYPRLKGAAISILAIHDRQHGTDFVSNYDPNSNDADASTRLGHGAVVCQRCHADNVIANVKSAYRSNGRLVPPLTEAIHNNHRNLALADSKGRTGGCQGCHPAHRSDGDMANYPITEDGLNAFAGGDNRDAAGGCFVGRDVHSNPNKGDELATDEHLNAVGEWLATNVFDEGTTNGKPEGGLWCTNCHSQLGQELWKNDNWSDPVHNVGTTLRNSPDLDTVASGLGITTTQAINWLDPKGKECTRVGAGHSLGDSCTANSDCGTNGRCNDRAAAIWTSDPGLCDYVPSLFGGTASPYQDGNVATIEVALNNGTQACSTPVSAPGPDCNADSQPDFFICGSTDTDGDFSVHALDFCTTSDCVTAAQATLGNSAAVPVPFSAATDGRDHWLSAGEPHCADCHAAPYVEQSGNQSPYPPFNYPNKPALFRYTRGHRDITCQGCHESPHGLYPVTAPGYVPGSTLAVDQTSWDQAEGLNTDGSHGPLKCGSCHAANRNGVTAWAQNLVYQGTKISKDFDKAVSWMHTATDQADPRADICTNCHNDRTDRMCKSGSGSSCNWDSRWLAHAMKGHVSRNTMDKVEVAQVGYVAGDPSSQNPLNTVCTSCHSNDNADVSCTGSDNVEWKRHLTEGRVSHAVWESVSTDLAGSTCGW